MDEREYERRIRECIPTLYRVARSILFDAQDCADAVQEAVFQGWVKRRQLRDPDRFQAWLIRIVVNECRNIQRRALKQKRAIEASMEDARRSPPCKCTTELEAAVSRLPEKYRLPIVLYYAEDYPTKEIAELLGMPDGRVRERMHTARKMLRGMLKYGPEE